MPWTADDAHGHTGHADTPHKKKQWAAVANAALSDGKDDAAAIRIANAAVHKMVTETIADRVGEYLRRNAPNIYEMYLKDMTSGDTHVPTALGNEDKKKKISTAYVQDDNKDDELAEKGWLEGTMDKIHKDADKRHLRKVLDAVDPPIDADLTLKITKIDPDQQKVFGWAFVSQRGDYLIIDKQGDIILPEDLELGAHDFALNWRSQGDMHSMTDGVPDRRGNMIESLVFTKEKADAGVIAKDPETGEQLYGWFVGFKVDDPQLWEAHKRGDRPEFSIGGKGRRVEVDV